MDELAGRDEWQGERVPYALEMFFDEEADTAVRQLWGRLSGSGLASLATRTHGRHRPHVSLTIMPSLPDVDVESVAAAVAASVGELPSPLNLAWLGTFAGSGGVLFLGAVVTTPLLRLHVEVCSVLHAREVQQLPYYLPGAWVPHCTLAQDLAPVELASALQLLADFEPVDAVVSDAGITDITTGEVTFLTR